jgi:hypothetical protein
MNTFVLLHEGRPLPIRGADLIRIAPARGDPIAPRAALFARHWFRFINHRQALHIRRFVNPKGVTFLIRDQPDVPAVSVLLSASTRIDRAITLPLALIIQPENFDRLAQLVHKRNVRFRPVARGRTRTRLGAQPFGSASEAAPAAPSVSSLPLFRFSTQLLPAPTNLTVAPSALKVEFR